MSEFSDNLPLFSCTTPQIANTDDADTDDSALICLGKSVAWSWLTPHVVVPLAHHVMMLGLGITKKPPRNSLGIAWRFYAAIIGNIH